LRSQPIYNGWFWRRADWNLHIQHYTQIEAKGQADWLGRLNMLQC
jgi:hypothetical protein